ncbi:hypothetical protein N7471_007774 [Penicillium samsonianum]|uniref:uncharacterized protein n=1 Tax=Penicillium samsonianum TaxID=1882272 RepID=UPI002548DC1A|nr:uncharacterized protein N7471_007774 [Penicillium samsonianum]KAJ6132559.1 hypothetical protein N7471_007774 [Penicillium samsonianum]
MHPAQASGTVVVTNNAKRYACDRCRDLKLRCPRNYEDAPCDRCLRADARCVTSSGRPLGRPPGQPESHVGVAVNQASYHPQYKRQRVTGDPPATTRARRPVGVSGASAIPSHSPAKPMRASYHHHHPSVPTNPGPSQFDGMLDMQLEDIHGPYDLREPSTGSTCLGSHGSGFPATGSGDTSPFFKSPQWCAAAHDSLDGTYTGNRDASHTQSIPNPDEFCDYDIGAPDMEQSLYDEAHDSNCARPDAPNMSSNGRNGTDTGSMTGRPNSDWTMPLINALGSISRQLAELRIQACDLSSSPVGACTFKGITPNLDFLDTPFVTALRTPPHCGQSCWKGSHGHDEIRAGAADDGAVAGGLDRFRGRERLSLRSRGRCLSPHVRSLIACADVLGQHRAAGHANGPLGELFDIILSPTIQFLDNSANVARAPGEPTGKTPYAPITPRPSDPQRPSLGTSATSHRSPTSAQGAARPRTQDILMTIRVVEHQLHTLESLIGLPAQYCLVGRKDVSANVMYRHEASVLAKAVMRQALQTLISLKKTLDCIQTAVGAPNNPARRGADDSLKKGNLWTVS